MEAHVRKTEKEPGLAAFLAQAFEKETIGEGVVKVERPVAPYMPHVGKRIWDLHELAHAARAKTDSIVGLLVFARQSKESEEATIISALLGEAEHRIDQMRTRITPDYPRGEGHCERCGGPSVDSGRLHRFLAEVGAERDVALAMLKRRDPSEWRATLDRLASGAKKKRAR